MLDTYIISNEIHGLDHYFCGNDVANYRFVPVSAGLHLDLSQADVLVVPNGSDHIAMYGARHPVHQFLERGGHLLCFDGWFTDWIPGNRWIHDNARATRDIRYRVHTDRYELFDGVELDDLQFNHGISGWWACGYIEPAPGADILLCDTWERPVIVLDESTTRGTMILTASGPLSDVTFEKEVNGLSRLYQNMLRFLNYKQMLRICY